MLHHILGCSIIPMDNENHVNILLRCHNHTCVPKYNFFVKKNGLERAREGVGSPFLKAEVAARA